MQKLIVLVIGLLFGPLATAHASPIQIPEARIFSSHRDVYSSGKGEHILIILHVPKKSGAAFVEVYNRTQDEVSLFRLTLTALGHEGELDFDDLPAGWSAVKEVKLTSLYELALSNVQAYNANADEITPRLVFHQITTPGKMPKIGKRKL